MNKQVACCGMCEWVERPPIAVLRVGSVRDWVSPAAGHKYGALYAALPTKAGTQGCGSRTLCALLTSLDVANGMKLLHKYKILHSDLKPHNVLLCSSHTVRTLAALPILAGARGGACQLLTCAIPPPAVGGTADACRDWSGQRSQPVCVAAFILVLLSWSSCPSVHEMVWQSLWWPQGHPPERMILI